MAGDSTIGSILEEMATLERDLDSEVRRQLAVVFKRVDPGELGEEMAASHDQARAARRVADLLGVRPRTVVRYGTVALTALLTLDPSEAVRVAVSQLGELAADNDNMTRLRATLRVYYEENVSPARAARRLGVHQNTIVYRVKRVEEILSHTVEQGRLELEVALSPVRRSRQAPLSRRRRSVATSLTTRSELTATTLPRRSSPPVTAATLSLALWPLNVSRRQSWRPVLGHGCTSASDPSHGSGSHRSPSARIGGAAAAGPRGGALRTGAPGVATTQVTRLPRPGTAR
jgi:hypothetical protein